MFLTHTDAVVGDLVFARSFNSERRSQGRYGSFGPGWNATFEARLVIRSDRPRVVEARTSDASPQYYYNVDPTAIRLDSALPFSTESWIERTFVQGVVTGYRRVFRAGGHEAYDATGRLQSVTERSGLQTTYAYAQDRLASVTRLGRGITIEYDGSATRPARLLGPGGVLLATYTYVNDRLDTVQYNDESGSGYRYTYDPWNSHLWAVVDLEGKKIEAHTYVGEQARTSEIGDGLEKLTFAYQTNKTLVTDARQNVTTYEYTTVRGTGIVTKVTGPCSSCGGGGGGTQEWTYDDYGRIKRYEDGDGNPATFTTYTYDPATGDLLTETRRPDAATTLVTTYTYHPDGRLKTREDPRHGLTTWTYETVAGEENQTVTQLVSPGENRETVTWYNTIGRPRLIVDPRQKETRLFYTAEGDLDHMIDPAGKETRFWYDDLGRRKQVIPPVATPLAREPISEYNTRGQVRKIIDPTDSNKYTLITYDRGGRRIEVRDPLQVADPVRRTEYNYDNYGRLWRTRRWVVGPNGAVAQDTQFHYDSMSNLEWIEDARGKRTTFEYDGYNRVKAVLDPPDSTETRREEFTYYDNGLLWTRKDRRDVITTYTYDGMGRLTGKSYAGGSVPTAAVTFGYDGSSNLNLATDGATTLTWTHNLAGEPATATNQQQQITLTYRYDNAGNRESIDTALGFSLSYDYDDLGRLWHIFRGTDTFTFGYDDASRRRTLTYPNTVVANLTPDDRSRLDVLEVLRGTSTIARFDYGYDDVGNRTSKATPTVNETYTYDDVYQLDNVSRNSTPVEDFNHDAVGNRKGTLNRPDPSQWVYSNRNELLLEGCATCPTYGYDNNGNRIVLQLNNPVTNSWEYEWDAENRLTHVYEGGGSPVASYRYDPLGRRVEKLIGGVLTTYVYDGEDILRERVGSSDRYYVHGPGVDEPLARVAGTTVTYFHADGLGSIVNHTNAAGSVVYSRSYDAFGNLETGAGEGGYAFTGREWDPETGLYYYRARYYDPKIGRFLSEDPIGFEGGDINLYAYVGNSPASRADPMGLQWPGATPFPFPIPFPWCPDWPKVKVMAPPAPMVVGAAVGLAALGTGASSLPTSDLDELYNPEVCGARNEKGCGVVQSKSTSQSKTNQGSCLKDYAKRAADCRQFKDPETLRLCLEYAARMLQFCKDTRGE